MRPSENGCRARVVLVRGEKPLATGRAPTENRPRRKPTVKPVTDEDIKRTLSEFYAAVDDQGREGLFPIAVVFVSEDGSGSTCYAEHMGPRGNCFGNWPARSGTTTRRSTHRAGRIRVRVDVLERLGPQTWGLRE